MFFSIDRIGIVEYLTMEIHGVGTFILRSPPISYVSNIYYLPFTVGVWACSISLVILCTAVIAITLKFHRQSGVDANNMKLSDYFLFAIASTCQMGANILTKVSSTRIAMVIFLYNDKSMTSICLNIHCSFSISFYIRQTIFFILKSFSADFIHCLAFHLHFVYGKYCCITSVNIQIISNNQ